MVRKRSFESTEIVGEVRFWTREFRRLGYSEVLRDRLLAGATTIITATDNLIARSVAVGNQISSFRNVASLADFLNFSKLARMTAICATHRLNGRPERFRYGVHV
jgi:hypothetical protein